MTYKINPADYHTHTCSECECMFDCRARRHPDWQRTFFCGPCEANIIRGIDNEEEMREFYKDLKAADMLAVAREAARKVMR